MACRRPRTRFWSRPAPPRHQAPLSWMKPGRPPLVVTLSSGRPRLLLAPPAQLPLEPPDDEPARTDSAFRSPSRAPAGLARRRAVPQEEELPSPTGGSGAPSFATTGGTYRRLDGRHVSPIGSGSKGEPLGRRGWAGASPIARVTGRGRRSVDFGAHTRDRRRAEHTPSGGSLGGGSAGASESSGTEVGGGPHLDAVLFSAKEAIFKAWYPLTKALARIRGRGALDRELRHLHRSTAGSRRRGLRGAARAARRAVGLG